MTHHFPLSVMLLAAIPALAQSPGTFTATGNMNTSRSFHTATLLQDGRVLIAGGRTTRTLGSVETTLASAELYDPSTATFTATGSMITARGLHTATLLADGRVLIAGGDAAGSSPGATAEIFDPSTGTFTATGDMIQTRSWHTAILLENGKVLIVGGPYGAAIFAGAELYDPATGKFGAAGEYAVSPDCDFCAPGVLLANGDVLFAQQTRAQIYHPDTGTFSTTGATSHCLTGAALLMGGKVLFAGGECDEEGRSFRAELYDPALRTFTATGNMMLSRVWHTLTLLPDGMVLVAGGETDACSTGGLCPFAGSVASAELYDTSTGTFAATGGMTVARETHASTLLKDGRVLLSGGESYGGIGIFYGTTTSAELYTPAVLVPAPVLFSLTGDGQGQGAIWHAETGPVASPANPAVSGEVLSLYTTSLADRNVIPPQVAVGGRLAEILYFGAAPGYPGYYQVNFRVPSGIAPGVIAQGSGVPVRLTYLGRPSNAVTIGVQ